MQNVSSTDVVEHISMGKSTWSYDRLCAEVRRTHAFGVSVRNQGVSRAVSVSAGRKFCGGKRIGQEPCPAPQGLSGSLVSTCN